MAIPAYDGNLVLPPHLGNPTNRTELSPYPCTTVELCQRFGTTVERRAILGKYLDFRERIQQENLTTGYQWLDGSFLEDIETRERRAPNDLDLITVYWGYDAGFQQNLLSRFQEFANPALSKSTYSLDHYPFDAGYTPEFTIEGMRYWLLLFSHNRDKVWKGMLRVELNTPTDDTAARAELVRLSS